MIIHQIIESELKRKNDQLKGILAMAKNHSHRLPAGMIEALSFTVSDYENILSLVGKLKVQGESK